MSRSKNYEEIAQQIHSDTSPVGIDAKKTHILILQMLAEVLDKLDELDGRIGKLEEKVK